MAEGWLDRGHGDGQALAPLRATAPSDAGVAVRSRPRLAWFGSPLAVAIVAGTVLIGSAGTVYAIRETLFPSIGASTARSVWQNPAPADPPAAVVVTSDPTRSQPATSVTATTATSTSTTAPATSTPSTTSVQVADGVPADTPRASDPRSTVSVAPTVTIDDHEGPDDSDNSGPDNSGPDNSGSGSSGSDNSGSGDSGSDD